jgi:ribosomal protein L29
MKKKELTDIKVKKSEELIGLVKDKKLKLSKVQVEIKAGKEKNLKKIKNLKKDIAQILTIAKEKEIVEKEGKK